MNQKAFLFLLILLHTSIAQTNSLRAFGRLTTTATQHAKNLFATVARFIETINNSSLHAAHQNLNTEFIAVNKKMWDEIGSIRITALDPDEFNAKKAAIILKYNAELKYIASNMTALEKMINKESTHGYINPLSA